LRRAKLKFLCSMLALAPLPQPVEFLGRSRLLSRSRRCSTDIFRGWERWCADLLSSHISYPGAELYFRSQHSNQSWLSALTVMLDVTSLVMTGVDGIHRRSG
jgi:hypothetical protein